MGRLLARSWTLSLARDLLPVMTLGSALRYRRHLLAESATGRADNPVLRLRLRRPYAGNIELRTTGSDLAIFDEVILLEQVYRNVVERVPGCRTVLDLGANVGLAALYFAAHYPRARIFCVEPNPPAFELLRRNLEPLERAGRADALCGAAWSAEASLEGERPPRADDSSMFATREAAGPSATIRGYPMARLLELARFPHADLVKVDIEGAERQLFSGDLGWLDRVGALAIEFHDGSRSDSRFDEIMGARGFAVESDQRHTVVAVRR